MHLGTDCHGMNFYRVDPAFQQLLDLYPPSKPHQLIDPFFDKLSELAGGRSVHGRSLVPLTDYHIA